MRVQLVIEAIDRASRVIDGVHRAAAAMNTADTLANVKAARERASAAQAQAQSNLVGAVATAASVAAPIGKAVAQFNAYEDILNDVGSKAELTGEKLAAFGATVRAQARDLNMSSAAMLNGVDQLAAGGLAVEASARAFPALGRASIATKASLEDLSKTAVSLVNNLKIDPAEIIRALDAMAQTGKDGQFELKDMAQYFPKLGAQYATMGQTGQKAVLDLSAMLQVMRKNTGTAGEAVTNLQDLLLKITMPPAVKALKAAGIDAREEMQEAAKSGQVMERMFDIINRATGGDQSKLQTIFSDKQALAGAQALMQHYEEYLKLRQRAEQATGVIDRDFAVRMKLGVEQTRALGVAFTELGTTLGQALAPMIGAKLERVTSLVWTFEQWAKANPQLVSTLAMIATGVTGLMVAMAALSFVFATLRVGLLALFTPLRLLITPLSWLLTAGGVLRAFFGVLFSTISAGVAAVGGWGAAFGIMATRLGGLLSWLLSPLALVGRAFMALGAAMMATPVGWIIAAIAVIAAGAYLIYRNWGQIGPWMASLWASIGAGMRAAWDGLIGWLGSIGGRISGALGSAWSSVTGWFAGLSWPSLPSFSALIGDVFAPVVSALGTGWQAVTGWFAGLSWPSLPSFSALIGDVFGPVVSALGAGWQTVTGWFTGLSWPSLPAIPDPLAAIRAVLDPVVTFLGDWGGKLLGAFEGAFGRVTSFIEGAAGRIGAVIGGVTSGLSKVSDMIFGPSAASVTATADQARAAKAAIDAIAPAAQSAVSATTAVFSGISFHSHGVAMMETLATGIRAGAASAVAAARTTVQQIRDHLPHSPAKVGPLSDLDRVQFGQTLAGAIRAGSPAAVAAVAGLSAGLAGALPGQLATPAMAAPAGQAQGGAPAFASPEPGRSAPAAGGGGSVSTAGPVQVSLTLSPNFSGSTGPEFIQQLRDALPGIGYELGQAIQAELERRDRTKH